MNIKKIIIICAAIAATACLVTGLMVYFSVTSQERGNEIRIGTGNYDDIAKYMEISDLESLIENYYITEVEENNLVNGALKGMVEALDDPYSVYYTEDEYADYSASSEGTFVGVGIQMAPVSRESGYLKVVSVHKGGPAESAGIFANDIITAVDGLDLMYLDYESAMHMVNGPSGSNVMLTVETNGVPREASMVRSDVQVPSVTYYMLDERIGVIIISDFRADSAEEFASSLDKLIEEEEAEALLIDIRDNVGTSIKGATDILDQIIPPGLLTYSIDRDGSRNDVAAKGDYNNIPMVLLVNGATANASEIFAGAVQDNARGQVIGTQTFGKGVVQTVMEMPYSGGGVKLTTAEHFTPQGHQINGVGIAPDLLVEMPEDVVGLTEETDQQLQAARQALHTLLGGE